MRASLLLAVLCSCGSPGTYVLLTVQASPGAGDGIASLELALQLGGRNATAHFDKGGAALSLPTTLILDIGNGAGSLAIDAEARDAGGQKVAEGSGTATVIHGQTATASITLDLPGSQLLTVDRTDYDFGTITQSTTAGPVSLVVTNGGTGTTAALALHLEGDSGAFAVSGCEGQTLAPTASCTLQVSFKPTSAGSFQMTLTISGSPGGSASTTLHGTAVAPSPLQIAPTPKDYGGVLVGVTLPQVFTVTNSGSDSSGALTSAVTGSDASQFVVGSDGCSGQPLQPQSSCTVTVTFTPSGSTGDRAASLTVSGTPGGTAVATLAGRALTPAAVSFNEDAHDFGTLDVGQPTAAVDFTVTNSGGQSTGMLTTNLTGSSADFVVDMNACTGQVLPYLGTCTVRGHFAPQSFGPKSLTVTVSGTPGGDAAVEWKGVGHDQVTLTVTQPFGGDGSGSVSGAGVDCPANACSAVVDRSGAAAPTVMLTATPEVGSLFVSWSGDCSGANPQCALTLDGNKSAKPTFNRQRFTLTVTQNNTAGASGTVTSTTTPSEPGEIACGATCNVDRYYGAMVTLSPSPSPGFYFGGWAGDCTGAGACIVAMTATHSVEARFTPANKIFTTAATYSMTDVQSHGSGATQALQMVSGADAICGAAGGSGNWVAFISSTGVGGRGRIPTGARGWVRPDGKAFGDSLGSILDSGRMFYPSLLDESGNPVGPLEQLWTGSNGNGTAASSNCANWTDTGTFSFTDAGVAGGLGSSWLAEIGGCGSAKHVLCMQTDYFAVVAPTPPPVGSRHIFLTAGAINGGVGLAAADSLCQSEAAGNLPGSYLAFLGTNGASPASRFTPRGAVVVRPDGTVVAQSDTSLFAGDAILTPPYQQAGGGYNGGTLLQVWTGATAANTAGASGNTCYDTAGSWTSTPARGQVGRGTITASWENQGNTNGCIVTQPIYCLEE